MSGGRRRASCRIGATLAALAAVCAPAALARADRGDVAAGLRVGYLPRHRLASGVDAMLGVGDWAQVLASLAVDWQPRGGDWAARALVGATVLLDATAWVPAATAALGARRAGGGWGPVAAGRLEIRHFLGRHVFASLAAGGLWDGGGLAPEVGLMLAWQN